MKECSKFPADGLVVIYLNIKIDRRKLQGKMKPFLFVYQPSSLKPHKLNLAVANFSFTASPYSRNLL